MFAIQHLRDTSSEVPELEVNLGTAISGIPTCNAQILEPERLLLHLELHNFMGRRSVTKLQNKERKFKCFRLCSTDRPEGRNNFTN
jgi:hypothetical protein